MRRTWTSLPHLAALAAIGSLAALLWVWHAQAWDLGRRSPVLSYDAAQYAVAARELAEHYRLATPFALPIELVRHPSPPWPLAVVQPGLVVFEALVEKLVPPVVKLGSFRVKLREPHRREWLALLLPTLCFVMSAGLLALAIGGLVDHTKRAGPTLLAAAGLVLGASFLLDPESQHFAVGGFTELPYTLCTLVALYWVATGRASRSPLSCGILLGIAGAFRANMLFLAPLYAFAAALAPAKPPPPNLGPGRLGIVFQMLLGFALPLAPWWIYKWISFGTPTWDLTRFVIWDGVEGRSWLSLLHLPSEPQVPVGQAAVVALARKAMSNAPALLLALATGPRALWVGSLVLWLLVARPRRSLAVAAWLILAQAVVSLGLAAVGIPWLRYVFPARVAMEAAGLLAFWGLLERLATGAQRDPSISPAGSGPAIGSRTARALAVGGALLALGWGAWQTTRGNAEARATAETRGLPSVLTLRDLSARLNRELRAGEPVMSNLGPTLAWYARRPVVHLAWGPGDLEACRRRLPFRHVLLVFRDAERAWPEWRELLARPETADINAEWGIAHARRWRTSDGFLAVWLELGPVRPQMVCAPTRGSYAKSVTHSETRTTPKRSSRIPLAIISPMVTLPVAYTRALGGVETGSMKPNEHAAVAASAGGIGSTPAA